MTKPGRDKTRSRHIANRFAKFRTFCSFSGGETPPLYLQDEILHGIAHLWFATPCHISLIFRPQCIYAVAPDVTRSVICVSVCLCVLGRWVSCAKTAVPIKMPFVEQACVSPRNHVLDGNPDSSWEGGIFKGDIPHCSPAATGECACSAHVADECIHCHEE